MELQGVSNKLKTKGKRILVAYESQFGSTAEVAKFIGEKLSREKVEIDVKKIKEIDDISAYDRVVVGSAIQYDKWMPEAREFVIKNSQILADLPVAYFFTCLTLTKKTKKTRKQANGYAEKLNQLATDVNPISIGQFAGALDYKKMSLGSRILAKGLFAILGVKEGDYRDWEEIQKWAEDLKF